MKDSLKPILRLVKYTWLYQSSKYQASKAIRKSKTSREEKPSIFIIGCGRSGTTILGKLLSLHPSIAYYFEPYHLWAALDQRTDVLNLFHHGPSNLKMDQSFVNDETKLVFKHLFRAKNKKILIEKTPLNIFRIGYLRALAPNAKFIHIVRDGVDVANSIGNIATGSPYKIATKPLLNQWWGVAESKWKTLKTEGKQAQYCQHEVELLRTQKQRGAYEWLASLTELESWRSKLGEHLYEVNYSDLVENPAEELQNIFQFLDLNISRDLLNSLVKEIKPQSSKLNSLDLPSNMMGKFNEFQTKFQFKNKATLIATE